GGNYKIWFTGYWLLVTGYWLLVTGYWLLVTGYWLLATPPAAAATGDLQFLIGPWSGAAFGEPSHFHDVQRVDRRGRESPGAADVRERRSDLLVAQCRPQRRHQTDGPFLSADQNPNHRGRVGSVHECRVDEIRAQLLLAAAVVLMTTQADILVDLGARLEALLLLRRQRSGRHDRRRPPRPIQLRRHSPGEDRARI